MTAIKQTLAERFNAFRRSSAFTPGDPYSFRVVIAGGLELPGKYNPADFLSFCPSIAGRLAVICPGNGGLCAELARRGGTVFAFEPRSRFQKGFKAFSPFPSPTKTIAPVIQSITIVKNLFFLPT